jgi:hypothetical protein
MTVKNETTVSTAVNPPGLMHIGDLFKDYKKKKIYKQYWYKLQKQLLGLSGVREMDLLKDLEDGKYLHMVYALISHAHALKGSDEKMNEIIDEYMKDLDEVVKVILTDADISKDEFKELYYMLAGTLEGIKHSQEAGFVLDGVVEDEEEEGVDEASYTPGMVKAYNKLKLKLKCSECGVVIPVYPGRYPKNCPNCASTFRAFREPAQGGSMGPQGHVKAPKTTKMPKAEAKVREANIKAEIKKRPALLEAIKSLDPKKPNIHKALKCYNTVMTRIIIEDERTNCGIMEEMIPGMLMEMAALLSGKDIVTIINRFQKAFTGDPEEINEREVKRYEFLKAIEGMDKEENGVVKTYRNPESNKIIAQEILRPGKSPVYIMGEFTEDKREEGSVKEVKSEKDVAQGMARKGYKFVLVPTAGKDERNLFAKTMNLAKDLVKDFPQQKLKVIPMDKYLKGESVEDKVKAKMEAGMGSSSGGPSSGKLKRGEGKFSIQQTRTGVQYVYNVRGKRFVTTTMDPKVADERRWQMELMIAANAYFLSGKIPRGSVQISMKKESEEDKKRKKMIRVKLNPKKKIGYTMHGVGPKGKKTLLKKEGRDTALKMGIKNPNSSGQGEHPDHKKNPHHRSLEGLGFKYSHTTPIGRRGGDFYLHHTYKMGDFNVGVHQNERDEWVWSGSKGGSGRRQTGRGDSSLTKYLKGVKKRMKKESVEEGFAEQSPKTRALLMKKFGKDPLYAKVIQAKSATEMKKAIETLTKIRGPNSLELMKKYIKSKMETVDSKVENRLNEEFVEIGPSGRKKKQVFTQYAVKDNTFYPAGNPMERAKKLDPGIYAVKDSMSGPLYTVHEIKTDELLKFEDARLEEVLKEVDGFWDKKKKFEEMGFTHKRGILLYGDPGTGKSCLLKQAMEEMVARGDVVFTVSNPHVIVSALKTFRDIEKDRKVLVVIEDVDEMCKYNERNILQLFDGDDQVDNILFLATTKS